ncbi:MAG: hypothetical protein A4E53_04666 [Pelotomaculum sp. PtaB.Bin104]|nr:MAG: hypothetical protein A4E53_04666 [Pelotomaculum sp. PtaB.Bin104]
MQADEGVLIVYMANVTEVRQNASMIISRVVETREPAVILQRSKPVVYVVEASAYEEMLKKVEEADRLLRVEETKSALQDLAKLRKKMAQKGKQPDSVPLIRDLREGKTR